MSTLESHLLTRLNDELARVMTIGRAPHALYVGVSEYAKLRCIAQDFMAISKDDFKSEFRWNGLWVLPVAVEHHIGFGFSPDHDSPCG